MVLSIFERAVVEIGGWSRLRDFASAVALLWIWGRVAGTWSWRGLRNVLLVTLVVWKPRRGSICFRKLSSSWPCKGALSPKIF